MKKNKETIQKLREQNKEARLQLAKKKAVTMLNWHMFCTLDCTSPLHYAYLIVVLNPTSAVFWKQGDEKVIDDAFRERDPNRHCAMRGMSGRVSTRITVTVLNY